MQEERTYAQESAKATAEENREAAEGVTAVEKVDAKTGVKPAATDAKDLLKAAAKVDMKTLTEVDPKVDAKAAVTGAVYFTQGRVRGRV